MMPTISFGKVIDENAHREMLVDWKKAMMEELARLVLERNLTIVDLVALVIRGVSKSLFAYWILTEPKPKDFTPLVHKIFEGI